MMKERKGRETKGAKGEKGEKGKRRARVAGVPPAESAVWPEQYRGRRWKSVYAILFAGRCQLCAYSCRPPKSRRLRDKWLGVTRLLLCTNHPSDPGELRELLPVETCRNFKATCWKRPRAKAGKGRPRTSGSAPETKVRRIPLGRGLFATVDAADYEELSQYKWYAKRHGPTIYATCIKKGRVVYMHRMIMRPAKGLLVDHIDGNGLNRSYSELGVSAVIVPGGP